MIHGVELQLWILVPPTAVPALGNTVLREDTSASLHKRYCLIATHTLACSISGSNAFAQTRLINLTGRVSVCCWRRGREDFSSCSRAEKAPGASSSSSSPIPNKAGKGTQLLRQELRNIWRMRTPRCPSGDAQKTLSEQMCH